MSDFLIIDSFLNTYLTTHSARSLHKLVSTYSEPDQRSKMERFGKKIILFNYLCKKLNLKSLSRF